MKEGKLYFKIEEWVYLWFKISVKISNSGEETRDMVDFFNKFSFGEQTFRLFR
jgi:hypothetical protein